MVRSILLMVMGTIGCFCCDTANAYATVFFNSSQVATTVSLDVNFDTISSEGYLFTYSRDKLFTGGVGLPDPIGRMVRVPWPQGVEAQAITVGPSVGTGAQITLRRVDGLPFDLTAFSAKLLANTGGAGGTIEIMPLLNGQDGFNDPLYFDATGYAGNVFSYNTSPNYLGSTALLKGFDEYHIKLYVDYALVALTLDAAVPNPADINGDGFVDLADLMEMAVQWLGAPGIPSADIAPYGGDGAVNILDLAFLASQWQ
jgi:hypothetical protein